MSNGVPPSARAPSRSDANAKVASRSTKRRIAQAHAVRSTWHLGLVTHSMPPPAPSAGLNSGSDSLDGAPDLGPRGGLCRIETSGRPQEDGATPLLDLLGQPFEILAGLRVGGQSPEPVVQHDSPAPAKPPPEGKAQPGRLTGEPVGAKQPIQRHLASRVTTVTLDVQSPGIGFPPDGAAVESEMTVPSRLGLAAYFLRLGATGFGGPVVLIEGMHRDLVEERGWVSEEEYREGVALAQLSPGPLAAQLCFYLGSLRGGVAGAALSGLGFVLPGFLMVVGLGWAYARFGGLPWMQAVFYGVGAAVIGLITKSAYRLTGKTIGRDGLLWGIFLILGAVTALTARENVWLIVLAGLVVWIIRAPPAWLQRPGTLAEAGSVLLLLQLLGFFTYAGSFVGEESQQLE